MGYLCLIIWICVWIFWFKLKKKRYFFVAFFRVFPDATVSSLREEIENQIGFEIIPREFVFLKCVGRCFTRVGLWCLKLGFSLESSVVLKFSRQILSVFPQRNNIEMSNDQPNIVFSGTGLRTKTKVFCPIGEVLSKWGIKPQPHIEHCS